MIKNLYASGKIKYNKYDKIKLIYDNRSIKLDAKMDLNAYFEHILLECDFINEVEIEPRNSEYNPEVRIADIIANTKYRIYQKSVE